MVGKGNLTGVAFEKRPTGGRRQPLEENWEKNMAARRSSKCKGPEARTFLCVLGKAWKR
jgi:hypothetical protein